MTLKFNDVKGTLLNNLPLDTNLNIMLESSNESKIKLDDTILHNYNNEDKEKSKVFDEEIKHMLKNIPFKELLHASISPNLTYFKDARAIVSHEEDENDTFTKNLFGNNSELGKLL